MVRVVQQNQQVDVGVGMQLATPIAADRDQGDVGVFAPVEPVPGLVEDLVDEPGTILDQATDVAPGSEALVEHFPGLLDRFLECVDGAGLQSQFRLELAVVEQFRIYLRHGMTSLG